MNQQHTSLAEWLNDAQPTDAVNEMKKLEEVNKAEKKRSPNRELLMAEVQASNKRFDGYTKEKRKKLRESAIQFASDAQVKTASSWMIARYAGTFQKLAETGESSQPRTCESCGKHGGRYDVSGANFRKWLCLNCLIEYSQECRAAQHEG